MLELGRPTHIFDLDKLDGPLTVRWGKEGEKGELLNGQTVDIDPYFGVISDNNGIEPSPASWAAIMPPSRWRRRMSLLKLPFGGPKPFRAAAEN